MYPVSYRQLLVPLILSTIHQFFLSAPYESYPSVLRRLYVRFDLSCIPCVLQ